MVLIAIKGFSQYNTFIIKAIDSKGLKDSVIMGEHPSATTGIDIDLEEIDYYGVAQKTLDIRSIHRNTVTQDNLWLLGGEVGLVEPFSNNIDLKKDIRKEDLWGQHFVLNINATNYPVKIIISHLNVEIDIPYCTYDNNIANTTAGELQRKKLIDKQDTIFIINSSTENKLIGFHPQQVTKINEQLYINSLFVYPNPATNKLFIKSTLSNNKNIMIFNSKGVELKRFTIFNYKEVDISNFEKGMYFLKCGNDVNKFIKK